jgi:hypothetical protein
MVVVVLTLGMKMEKRPYEQRKNDAANSLDGDQPAHGSVIE